MQKSNLLSAPAKIELKVIDMTEIKEDAQRRLASMGIRIGDNLIKLNEVNWGPVLIQNISLNATKLGLGRNIAANIFVEYEI